MSEFNTLKTFRADENFSYALEQSADERNHNPRSFFGNVDETALLEATRCLECKNPVCTEGCPVCIDIKDLYNLCCRFCRRK